MPVHETTLPGGGHGYQWGKHGHKYASKAGAERQARAIYANGYTGDDPHVAIGQAISELNSPPHKGAGVMFVAPDGHCLFLKRSEGGTRPGMWSWPGGTPEDGETPEETAKRETKEETDYDIERDLVPVNHRDGFSTFGTSAVKKFNPTLNDEHSDFVWAHPENPPQPLHPGVAATLADKKAMGAWEKLYGGSVIGHGVMTGDDALAQDKSARSVDDDGHMVVKHCLLTRAVVDPYRGEEIPGYQELGLEKNKIYHLYRDPKALKAAVPTLEGKPLLIEHRPMTSEDHQPRIVGGAIFNPEWNETEQAIYGDISVWRQDLIDDIEASKKRDLSMGYRYVPIMGAGVAPDGSRYDGKMDAIKFNHGATVPEGRVNGAMVADSADGLGWAALGDALDGLGFDAIASVLGIDGWEESSHPRGGNPKNAGQFSKGAGGGAAPQTRSSRRGGGTPRAELILQAQSFGMSFHRASHKRRAVLEEVVARLRGKAAPATQQAPAPKAAPAPVAQPQSEQRPSTQSRASKKELLKSLLEKTGKNPLKKLKEKGFEPSKKSVYYMDKAELQKALEHLEKKGKKEAPAAPKAPELTPIQKTVRDAFKTRTTDIKGDDLKNFVGAGERPSPELNRRRENVAALFNNHIKIKPKDFTKIMTNGLAEKVDIFGTGNDLQLNAKFSGGGRLTRRLNFGTKTVDHSYLQLPRSAQGGGMAKKLLASQIETYQQLGLEKVTIHANIDVGGYAWAKYGYVPNQDSWNQYRGMIRNRLNGMSNVPADVKSRVTTILDSDNPKAIWALADLPDKVDGLPLSKELMMDTHWFATLPLKDKDAMTRFNNYVNK